MKILQVLIALVVIPSTQIVSALQSFGTVSIAHHHSWIPLCRTQRKTRFSRFINHLNSKTLASSDPTIKSVSDQCLEDGKCDLDFVPDIPAPEIIEELKIFHSALSKQCYANASCAFDVAQILRVKGMKGLRDWAGGISRSFLNSSVINLSFFAILFGIIPLLKSFYGGDALWQAVVSRHSSWTLMAAVSFVLSTSFYWGASMLFAVLDTPALSKYFQFCKLQPRQHTTAEKYQDCVKTVLFNQFAINLPLGFGYWALMTRIGWSISDPLPTLGTIMKSLPVFLLLEEVIFYYIHRALHDNRIYRFIHKKHHEFTAPVGMAAIYAHPVEHLLVNLLPVFAGPLLLGSHLTLFWAWTISASAASVCSHSGHNYPYFTECTKHDAHHMLFDTMYSPFGVFDKVHGTDKKYLVYLDKKKKKAKDEIEKGQLTVEQRVL